MGLFAAEVMKLRTTRTASALLAATVIVSALAVASAVVVGADTGSIDLDTLGGLRSVLSVSASGSIFVLVVGVIITAGEFRQATVIDTFLTTPRRWRIILTKLGTAASVGVLFGLLSSGVSIVTASMAYRAKGIDIPLDAAETWSAVSGATLYAAMFGVIGAATGSIVRNQVAGIVAWLTWLSLIEHIAVGFAPSVGRWMPGAAGSALVRASREGLLGQSSAALLLVGYATLFGVAAAVTERGRDV